MPLTLLLSLLYFVAHCFVSFLAYYFLLMFVCNNFEMLIWSIITSDLAGTLLHLPICVVVTVLLKVVVVLVIVDVIAGVVRV